MKPQQIVIYAIIATLVFAGIYFVYSRQVKAGTATDTDDSAPAPTGAGYDVPKSSTEDD